MSARATSGFAWQQDRLGSFARAPRSARCLGDKVRGVYAGFRSPNHGTRYDNLGKLYNRTVTRFASYRCDTPSSKPLWPGVTRSTFMNAAQMNYCNPCVPHWMEFLGLSARVSS